MPHSHTIARIILEIQTGRLGDTWSLQEELSRLLWQQALPEMEALFDRLVGSEEVIRLDRVEVELQPLDEQFLAVDFVPSLLSALEQNLRDYLAGYHPASVEATRERCDRPSADWEIWLYFLRYGRLPWWGQSETWEDWLSRWQIALQSNSGWHTPFRELIASSASAQNRLLVQLPEAFRHQLVLLLQPTWIGWRSLLSQARQLMRALQLNHKTIQTLEQQAWTLLFAQISQSNQISPLPATVWIQHWLGQLVQHWLDQDMAILLDTVPRLNTGEQPITPSADSGMGDQSSQSSTNSSLADHSTDAHNTADPNTANLRIDERLLLARIEAYWQNIIRSSITTDQSLWYAALDQVIETQFSHLAPISFPTFVNRFTAQAIAPSTSTRTSSTLNSPSSTNVPPPWVERAIVLSSDEEATGIYLNQAGLVLLHPFLNLYFDDAGLLTDDHFRDETCQQIAIYLLHYLATRQTTPPEYELVLPKFLCGWHLDEPVHCPELPDTALTEAEHLLQTVIDYWTALKSTSPDGLREGFLQRQGKLTRTGDKTWKLQVEKQAIDVLLSRLPWGVSMVKLPWMDNLLTVEWT
jgi:hypothetical protein